MKRTINLATWNRREHFEFFSSLDEPFHGLVANLDCTGTFNHCRQQRQPFFLTYLYKILQAVNDTDAMRQRIEAGAVVEYERVQRGSGLGLKDTVVRNNDIHFSALPDIRFTGLTHARRYGTERCEPKISVGQVFQDGVHWRMPVAVFVHHGLVDGHHVGAFLKRTEQLFQNL